MPRTITINAVRIDQVFPSTDLLSLVALYSVGSNDPSGAFTWHPTAAMGGSLLYTPADGETLVDALNNVMAAAIKAEGLDMSSGDVVVDRNQNQLSTLQVSPQPQPLPPVSLS